MNIKVTQLFSYPKYLSVTVEGLCNHGDTSFERFDCGGLLYVNGELDYVEDYQPGEVCNTCGSWRLEDCEWNGIGELPMIHVRNSGKDIQDVSRSF